MPNPQRPLPLSPPAPSNQAKRRKRTTPRPKAQSVIERVNALPLAEFSTQYFCPNTTTTSRQPLPLHLSTWAAMSPSQQEQCIQLIERTSSAHYRASEKGWSRAKKLKEMRHPALKYLLLTPAPDAAAAAPTPPRPPAEASAAAAAAAAATDGGDDEVEEGELAGFLSFMPTMEDEHYVIYCYELHLRPRLRGHGVGREMMGVMERIGREVGVEKAMLTVFKSNPGAVKAYQRWGYGVDEFSPPARRLRGGRVRESSYVILSKGLLEVVGVDG